MTRGGDPARDRFVAVLASSAKLFERSKFYGRLLQAFCDRLLDSRIFMRLVGCRHDYQRAHFLETLGTQYAGIVFVGTLYRFEDFIREVTERFAGPKVMLDHYIEGLPMRSVQDDAAEGMRQLTAHLLELGHRSFAYLDMYRAEDNPWKREGVNAALQAAGLDELDRSRIAGCHDSYEDARTALEWFLDLEPRPTAVICFDDDRALYLLRAAAEHGLTVPGSLSIAGYGDTAVASGESRILTSVDTDPAAQGRKAAELITGEAVAEAGRILVPPRVMIRGSTAAPPQD